MNPQEFLQADRRWALWGCETHEQYLEKYFLPGRFHTAVPDKIREAFHTVERLIAYSFFYYPMEEEVGSKLSRIFEMAVRIRAQQLDIPLETKNKAGKIIPVSLGSLIEKLKINPSSDQDWAKEWMDFKSLRNLHAHPMGPNYGVAMNLRLVAPMINVINSIFIPKEWFRDTREKIKLLQERTEFYSKGIYVLDRSDHRIIITRAIPIVVSHDNKRSLWIFEPVGVKFPQNLDDYFVFNPILLNLADVVFDDESLCGYDYKNSITVTISPTYNQDDLAYTKSYFEQQNNAEEQVRMMHNQNTTYQLYYEREKFIYDEFWEKL